MFQQELSYFQERQIDLVNQYRGKILVIKGREILGVYSHAIEALNETLKDHELGTFMIQPCEPGPEAYTVTISTSGILVY